MVSFAARIFLDAAIVVLILASIVEVVVDVRGIQTPQFLPRALAEQPPSEPATALGALGVGLLAFGTIVEMGLFTGALPGGRVLIGSIAVLAFLFAGGFVVDEA